MSELSQELLKEHFEYRDGHLWWVKPTARRVNIGDRFGFETKEGYIYGGFLNNYYLEHRLIWFYHHGVWPKELDHRDTIKSNNDINNLREATGTENQFNKSYGKGSSSYKGVHYRSSSNKWIAQYNLYGKKKHIGCFVTEIEAAEAYRKATEHLHKEYANYG